MQLPRGGRITPEQTQGEWLLVLEGRMPCMLSTPLPGTPDDPRRDKSPQSRLNSSPRTPNGKGSPGRQWSKIGMAQSPPQEEWLEAGSALWEHATRMDRHSARKPHSHVPPSRVEACAPSRPVSPSILAWLLGSTMPSDTPSSAAPYWVELKTRPEGEEPAVVRGIHLSTARSRLVALKESLARQHSQVLAIAPQHVYQDAQALANT